MIEVIVYIGEYDVDKVWDAIESFAEKECFEICDCDDRIAQRILETTTTEAVLRKDNEYFVLVWKGKCLCLETLEYYGFSREEVIKK